MKKDTFPFSRRFQFLITVLVLVLTAACTENGDGEANAARAPADVEPDVTAGVEREATTGGEAPIVWMADFETGDLSQWKINNGSSMTKVDSGRCRRPREGVTTDQAHSGRYSMEMTIFSEREAGCRQFRKAEPKTGEPLYYSAWFYLPEPVQVGRNWNIFQFKAQGSDHPSGLFWKLEIRNDEQGNMYVVPVWKGPIPGPHAEDQTIEARLYPQTLKQVPVGEWFHLEVYLKQSGEFDGQFIVWQDGVEIFNIDNVRTKWPGSIQNWSVNNYGQGLQPDPATIYIDDVAISTERLGS